MVGTGLEDFLRRLVISTVAREKGLPWQPPDTTTSGVPARYSAGMFEFVEMHAVVAVPSKWNR